MATGSLFVMLTVVFALRFSRFKILASIDFETHTLPVHITQTQTVCGVSYTSKLDVRPSCREDVLHECADARVCNNYSPRSNCKFHN
jgi:hypothetical protein